MALFRVERNEMRIGHRFGIESQETNCRMVGVFSSSRSARAAGGTGSPYFQTGPSTGRYGVIAHLHELHRVPVIYIRWLIHTPNPSPTRPALHRPRCSGFHSKWNLVVEDRLAAVRLRGRRD